jgi:hypothetical protein
VRGGVLLRGCRCHRRRNVPAVLGGRVVGGGQPDLQFVSGELEFAGRVRCAHSLHLQRRGNRVRRRSVRVLCGRKTQGRFGLRRVHRLQRQYALCDRGRYSGEYLSNLSSVLSDIGFRTDRCLGLSLQSGVLRTKRRDVWRLCSGEVHGRYWLCSVHRLRRRQVLHGYRSYFSQHVHELRRRQVPHNRGSRSRDRLHGMRRRDVLGSDGRDCGFDMRKLQPQHLLYCYRSYIILYLRKLPW